MRNIELKQVRKISDKLAVFYASAALQINRERVYIEPSQSGREDFSDSGFQ